MLRNKARMKFIAVSVLLGLAITLASSLRRSETDLSSTRALPCIMAIFQVPLNQTDYGFPAYWFSQVKMASVIGCGPILERYETYSLLLPGFLIDIFLYGICGGALLHLISILRANRNRGLPD